MYFPSPDIADVVTDQTDVVFGANGSSVTICSQIQTSAHTPNILWYHENLVGDINLVCIFTESRMHQEHVVGTLPDASGKTSLTLREATMSDAGRYFAIMNFGKTHVSGSAQYLVVTGRQYAHIFS